MKARFFNLVATSALLFSSPAIAREIFSNDVLACTVMGQGAEWGNNQTFLRMELEADENDQIVNTQKFRMTLADGIEREVDFEINLRMDTPTDSFVGSLKIFDPFTETFHTVQHSDSLMGSGEYLVYHFKGELPQQNGEQTIRRMLYFCQAQSGFSLR